MSLSQGQGKVPALEPRMADTRVFAAGIQNQTFSSNVISPQGDFNWTETHNGGAAVRCQSGYLELYATGSNGVCTAEFNLNLLDPSLMGAKLYNAQVFVNWSCLISANFFAKWDFKKGATGAWTAIPDAGQNTSAAGWKLTFFDLGALGLNGSESILKLRVYAYLRANQNNYVRISNFRIGAFYAEINDHAIQIGSSENINVTFQRFGTQSGLNASIDCYQVYFAINDPQIDDTDTVATRGGSFVGDVGSLTYVIDPESFTAAGQTLYYRLRIVNRTGNGVYWSPTYSLQVENAPLSPGDLTTIIVICAVAGGVGGTILVVGKKMGFRNMGRTIGDKLRRGSEKVKELGRKLARKVKR